jgi:hypothetical protein
VTDDAAADAHAAEVAEPPDGGLLLALDVWATGAWAALALLAAAFTGVLNLVAAIASLVLFAVGIVLFLWAFWLAVQRSRSDLIGIGGLYFLADSAPRAIQARFLVCLGVQVVVSLGVAIAHPFTALAFCTLVPMFGLGAAGLWGAMFGTFPPRPDDAA